MTTQTESFDTNQAGHDGNQKDNQKVSHTLQEAARLAGKSTRTLRRLVKDGRLPAELRTGPHGMEYRVTAAALATLTRADTLTLESPIIPITTGKPATTLDTGQEAERLRVEVLHVRELLEEKDRRIADLAGQLEERNRAESELRRLLLVTSNELQEARRQAIAPAVSEAKPEEQAGQVVEPELLPDEKPAASMAGRVESDPDRVADVEKPEEQEAAAIRRPWWKLWR